MLQTVSPLVLQLTLFLMTAVATHLVMSFGQTLIHYKVAHHPMGGKIFRNHINFHHTRYSDAHLVSRTYLGDEGNTTPYFFIPVFLAGGCAYFLLPLNLFVVMVIASAASFYAHVFFDKEYHVEGSRLRRFVWFRRRQELHFVHHRHANSNFGVIHFFWIRSRYLSKAGCPCITACCTCVRRAMTPLGMGQLAIEIGRRGFISILGSAAVASTTNIACSLVYRRLSRRQ